MNLNVYFHLKLNLTIAMRCLLMNKWVFFYYRRNVVNDTLRPNGYNIDIKIENKNSNVFYITELKCNNMI